MSAQHHHPRIPEKQNVVSADQQRRRIIVPQSRGIVGPAKRGKRPDPGAEPSIEHIWILFELRVAAWPQVSGGLAGKARPFTITTSELRAGVIPPQSLQCQIGMRCPHQSWREIHQSRMFAIQSRNIFRWFSGTIEMCPPSTAAVASSGQRLHLAEPLRRDARLDDRSCNAGTSPRKACDLPRAPAIPALPYPRQRSCAPRNDRALRRHRHSRSCARLPSSRQSRADCGGGPTRSRSDRAQA